MLPKNPVLQKLALALTISFCVCYAWLATRLAEPPTRVPHAFVSEVAVLHEGKAVSLAELRGIFFRETTRALRELNDIESMVKELGGFRQPLVVIIDMDRPLKLLTLHDRVVIGAETVRAPAQLSKAILKAWLLQNSRDEIRSSHLRLEVVSDLLLALNDGGLDLTVPRKAPLMFNPPKHWTHYASSYSEFCDSNWIALELKDLCRAKSARSSDMTPTMLSFRPLMGEMIWSALQDLPVARRIGVVKAWMRSLTERSSKPAQELVGASAKPTDRIAHEISRVVPEGVELKIDLSPLSEKIEVDLLVRLAADAGSGVDEVVYSLRDTRSIIGNDAGYVTTPSRSLIEPGAVDVRAKSLAVIGCSAPTVREVLKEMSSFKRVVFVRSCKEAGPQVLHLGSFSRAGIAGFASMNPMVEFIQLRPQAVALAMKRGQVRANQKIDTLLELQTANSLLGIDRSKWMQELQAFKVTGAIEAIEWYRLAPKTATNTSI